MSRSRCARPAPPEIKASGVGQPRWPLGLTNSTIRRKLTVLRSLFSYLQIYGYSGVNPAHGTLVAALVGLATVRPLRAVGRGMQEAA